MSVWGVEGHDWAMNVLRRALVNGRVRHAYLFAGAASVGKRTAARAFAQALNCQQVDVRQRPCGECTSCRKVMSDSHPDVLYSQADATTGSLRIDELRAIAGRLALKPYEGRYRVAILRDFDRANGQAQDALLKTLEEPPPHAVLIVLTSRPEDILPTITSRSQQIFLRPVPFEPLVDALRRAGADEPTAVLLARISGGRIGWALRALRDPTALDERSAALDLLEDALGQGRIGRFGLAETWSKGEKAALLVQLGWWQTYWRDVLLLREGQSTVTNSDRRDALAVWSKRLDRREILGVLRVLRDTRDALDTNANVRLALEVLLLDLPGLAREGA